MRKIDPGLHERLATLIGSMGCELIGCELTQQGRRMVFRIFIDKENGVTIDDCSKVSNQINAMFNVEDPMQGEYALEVSSPGIDRPLFVIEHYRKYVGKKVKIRLYSAINQRRQYSGVLVRIEGEDIYLLMDDSSQEVKLPFSAIDKAHLVGEINM